MPARIAGRIRPRVTSPSPPSTLAAGLIGGLAAEFYHRVWRHYRSPAAWTWSQPSDLPAQHGKSEGETMWLHEPSVAKRIMEEMVAEA